MAENQPPAAEKGAQAGEFDPMSMVDAELAAVRHSGADSVPDNIDVGDVPTENPGEIQWYEAVLENEKGALERRNDGHAAP